jgi:hypothetical protein
VLSERSVPAPLPSSRSLCSRFDRRASLALDAAGGLRGIGYASSDGVYSVENCSVSGRSRDIEYAHKPAHHSWLMIVEPIYSEMDV